MEGIHIPAIRGDFGDGIHAIAEQFPKGLRIWRLREAATQTDDRDRFFCEC